MNEDRFYLGVKALVRHPNGSVLLLKKSGKDWDLPGGRIQKDEAPEEALRREIFEETGLSNFALVQFLSTELTPIRTQDDSGLIFSIFLCELTEPLPIALSPQHDGFQWVALDEATSWLRDTFSIEVTV